MANQSKPLPIILTVYFACRSGYNLTLCFKIKLFLNILFCEWNCLTSTLSEGQKLVYKVKKIKTNFQKQGLH